MEAHRIRQAYLEMLVENGHTIIPRTPLVLRDDPTTLFTGSGMQPLLRYLLGEPHPAGTRIGDVQPCLRAQDIDEVGDNRHTTFFEMLGNWSLGDYSKSEQIPMLGISSPTSSACDPERIYVTCSSAIRSTASPATTRAPRSGRTCSPTPGSAASASTSTPRSAATRSATRAPGSPFTAHKNWWSRSGGAEEMPIGDPGGPDSEVFYYFPQVEHDTRVRPVPPPELRRRPVPRNRQLGLHAVPTNRSTGSWSCRGTTSISAAAWNGSRRPRIDSPDVYRDRVCCGRSWRRLQELSGQVLRGRDRRDAGGHRPPAGRRVPRRGRGASGQQGPVLRDAQAGAPGDALRP